MASAVAGRLTPVLQRKSLQLLPTSSLSKTVQSVQPTEDEPFPQERHLSSATWSGPRGIFTAMFGTSQAKACNWW